MPIDPSIPLQVQAPQMNPLQTMLQAAQLRYMNANANQLQQTIGANQAVSQAIQAHTDANGNTDWNSVKGALAGDPNGAFGLPALTKSLTENQQANVTLSNTQIDNANKMHQAIYQRMSTLDPNDPNFMSKVMQSGADIIKDYNADPSMVVRSLQSIPPDPAGRARWLQRGLASVSSTLDNLKAMTPTPTQVDTGGQIAFKDTNPLTNPGIVGSTVNKTLTPSDATSQVPIVQPNGTPGLISKAQAAQQQGNGQYVTGGAQGGSIGDGRYGSQPPANGGVLPTGLAPGVSQAADVAGTGSGNQLVADQQSAAGSGARIYQLQSALSALQKAGNTGPGTDQKNQIQSFLLAQTPGDLGKYLPGVDPQKIASYDEANKYLTQYASAKASALGGGTDSKLATTLSANASTHISSLAAQDVVKANIGLERMGQAQQDAWNSAGLPPDQYRTWAAKFGSTMDPRVFVADQIEPSKVKAMVEKMPPKEKAQFKAQYNWAVQKGYINGPQ
ncbi:hypothetical protein PEP31012_03712 [Pandoraea eparura]|uniref:Uncharacterized protein n=1 Tax=Pandoraea eparura TaxID=2508291 RepID=A0A5E4X6G3_9BURK|nr:hypothetical protein [Pandoraea eparura]VVE31715.1 hypothetical protein PEP31012_03712 [Pandoraea eparura]